MHKLARLNNTGNSYFLSQDWLFLRAISCMIESLLEYMLLVSSLNFRFLPLGSGHVLLSVQYLRWIFWGWRFAKGVHLIQVQQQVLFNPRKTYMLMSMVRKGLYTAHGIIKQTRSKEILIKWNEGDTQSPEIFWIRSLIWWCGNYYVKEGVSYIVRYLGKIMIS